MEFLWIILATFVGFAALAFGLLFPVYRFINREEEAAKAWTDDEIARRQRRDAPSGDGAPPPAPRPPAPRPPAPRPPASRPPDPAP